MKLLTSWLDAWLSANQRSLVVALPIGIWLKVGMNIGRLVDAGHTICVSLEVLRHTTKESFAPKMGTEHADDGATLKVADVVKDLVDL